MSLECKSSQIDLLMRANEPRDKGTARTTHPREHPLELRSGLGSILYYESVPTQASIELISQAYDMQ
jgi:hypothetical protein